jgi:tRNA U34 5-methylaminomethyl-2-thiouridine-forming methyltransferase MnmC
MCDRVPVFRQSGSPGSPAHVRGPGSRNADNLKAKPTRSATLGLVQDRSEYELVKLANGSHSIHSVAHGETFHPVVGPVVEAEALYVHQLRLLERLARLGREFVVWDVGLGAAANAVTVLRAARDTPSAIRLVSFDHTLSPLRFALEHAESLGYIANYRMPLEALAAGQRLVEFQDGLLSARWEFHLGDFPSLLDSVSAEAFPKPDAILFDAYSPAANPAMWTQPLFARLFHLLDPSRPCALPTYSRSTMLRVSLLLAGFFVGKGHATGEKEETTIAANSLELITEPLDSRWLQRAKNSTSAEPLWTPQYRQTPLAPATWERLRRNPQFRSPAG